MKAYKIVSKEPIMGNSLVKIVMAPQHILEKLSKEHGNLKNGSDKIDESANAPIKNYKDDGTFDRQLIQSGNVNVDVFSLEEEENVGVTETKQPEKNAAQRKTDNNIQVIARYRKQPSIVISKHKDVKNLFDLKGIQNVEHINHDASSHVNEIEDLNNVDVEMEPKKVIPDMINMKTPTSTPETIVNSTVSLIQTEAEELLSNPTTAKNLVESSTPEDIDVSSEFSDLQENFSSEINSNNDQSSDDPLEISAQEISTENNVPLVVLKILKNRTVLIEETAPPTVPDMLSVDTVDVPKSLTPVRPKKVSRSTTTSTTMSPLVVETKQSKFPKNVNLVDFSSKYQNDLKLDDISMESSPTMSLLDIETTQTPPHSDSTEKSKNTKRAVGDEGTFTNIVRPSPIRQNKGNFLNNETEAERTERLSKSMQRLMHFVTICGQIDSYLTKRFRSGLRNVAKIFDSIEDTRRRRSNLL